MNFEEILDDLGMTIAEFYAGIIALGAIVVSLVFLHSWFGISVFFILKLRAIVPKIMTMMKTIDSISLSISHIFRSA